MFVSVTVGLIGGRGEELPVVGRIFVVGPSHTWMDLTKAFNRWGPFAPVFTLATAG